MAGSNKNCPSAQNLSDFFEEKIAAIRRTTCGSTVLTSLPEATCSFNELKVCSMEAVKSVIMRRQSSHVP